MSKRPSATYSSKTSASLATFFPDRMKRRSISNGSSTHSSSYSQSNLRHSSSSSASASTTLSSTGSFTGRSLTDRPKGSWRTAESASRSFGDQPPKRDDDASVSSEQISRVDSVSKPIPTLENGAYNGQRVYTTYQVIYDPELSSSKSRGSKAIYRYDGNDAPTPKDPRVVDRDRYIRTSRGRKALVKTLPVPKYEVSLHNQNCSVV